MGADAIAAIRPALNELADAVRSTDESDEREWCLTLSLTGDEETAWIQVMPGTLNAAYPLVDPPETQIAAAIGDLARFLSLIDWQRELFATFDIGDIELNDLARIIDRYFVAILGAEDSEYAPDVELVQF